MDENKMNDDVLEENEDIEEEETLINDKWYIDLCEEEPETVVKEYDITATPNDFNILTLFSLIDNGVIKMPPFQRNYVWDEKRASKLIESIILGLPIPQVLVASWPHSPSPQACSHILLPPRTSDRPDIPDGSAAPDCWCTWGSSS